MATFNLLQQSFINNLPVANQRGLSSAELELLMSGTGTAYTFSGSTVKLQIDLAVQRSIDKFSYSFGAPSTSGITVQYGRDLQNLVFASPDLTSSGIEVTPSISGYTYPRYFVLTHVASSGGPTLTVSGLFIKNNETEIQYGTSGTIDSVTITASGNSGYSPITEVKVMNSGTIPTDIFVSIDTYNTQLSILENFEIAPTATGTFSSFDSDFSMPSGIPWEWGAFNGVSVISEDLRLEDPSFYFPTFVIGSTYNTATVQTVTTDNNAVGVKRSDDTYFFMVAGSSNQPLLLDPIRNLVVNGPIPLSAINNINQRTHQEYAWDGNDRVYYMLNRTANDQTVYYYKLSTNSHHSLATTPFYVRSQRAVAVTSGSLFIYGGQTSIPSADSDVGTQFWKLDLTTLAFTQITATIPVNLPGAGSVTIIGVENKYIYAISSTNNSFCRYRLDTNVWESLASPIVSAGKSLSYNSNTKEVLIYFNNAFSLYKHSTITSITNPTALLTNFPSSITAGESVVLGVENSMVYGYINNSNPNRSEKLYILNDVPPPSLNATISGTYTTPIFRLENTTDFHRMLIEYTKTSSSLVRFDAGIGVDNFEIRGSNDSPSIYNTVQNFESALDPEEFVIKSLVGETSIGTLGGNLVFSHQYISPTDTPYMSGYITYGFPLITTGDMQYKFWWNPPSNKLVSNANITKFYIVPYINTLVAGSVPERNTATLVRTVDDNMYIQLGQPSDSGGVYTQLKFYKGDATVNYGITAQTGTYYQIELMINWDTGDYKLYFNSALLGSGIIPLSRINLLAGSHSYEIHSLGQSISFEEKFKFISVSRVGNSSEDSTGILAVPIHRNDPLFGANGSLQWFPVTVNSALLPKYKFVQARLTLRGSNTFNYPTVQAIRFPKVIKLEDVSPGQTKSVFIRYKFPAANNISTNLVYLKSWMFTDKL